MSRTLDMICRCRNILADKSLKGLRIFTSNGSLFDKTTTAITFQMDKKAKDYNRDLDFTSQDLMEFAEDIKKVLKRWENEMVPQKNIKALLKTVVDGKLNLDPFCKEKCEVMSLRADTIEGLVRTLSILEYDAVYLYFLEEASRDTFALKHTKRFKLKDKG